LATLDSQRRDGNDSIVDGAALRDDRRPSLQFRTNGSMVPSMHETNDPTDGAGIQQWLRVSLRERALKPHAAGVDHLVVQSLEACDRGRLVAAAALMLAAERI
jgi:hypothetical protein